MSQEQLIALIAGALVFVLLVLIFMARRKRAKKTEDFINDPHERLRRALAKTRGGLLDALRKTLGGGLNDDVLGSLEEILVRADIGVEATEGLLTGLKAAYHDGSVKDQEQVLAYLKKELVAKLGADQSALNKAKSGPTVIVVAGVNGAGKTTSIAKLTHYLSQDGHRVLLAASDTFRAAAIEQLKTWADRLGVEIVQGQHGADPSSVAYDAHAKAVAKGFDYLIVDTAGRLHTDKNLMTELEKIGRVGKKHIPESPHEVLLVLDATSGQNAVRQAEAFLGVLPVSGIFLAKLDGTAKGAFVVVIRDRLGVPVKFVGLGEKATDIAPFNAEDFAAALLS